MRRRYPFEALREVRQDRVEQRGAELAGRLRQRERATRERERAELARKHEERKAAEVGHTERDRLEQGAARAADLQASLTFARGAAQRISQRALSERAAREREQLEQAAEARARGLLAQADADNQALTKHHERWEQAQNAAAELAADEAALDHWNSRARGRSRSGEGR